MLPLFPLGTVLFPGLVLPLHVFEERYRRLVADLLALPEQERELGVVALREGHEVGAGGARALHAVGCTARLHQVHRHDDGRYDLVTVGSRLFRVLTLHQPEQHPYLTADVEWLPDEPGDLVEAEVLATAVRAELRGYLAALGDAGGREIEVPALAEDPLVLSHQVAATVLLDLADRQDLLDQPDGRTRLRRELTVLRRESAFLRVLTAAPAPELTRTPYSLS